MPTYKKKPVKKVTPKKKPVKKVTPKKKPVKKVTPKKKPVKKVTPKKKQKGGGSDWKSTVYSRGPVNYPNNGFYDGKQLFDQFNKTGEYIPNSQLSGIDYSKCQ